MTLDQGSGNPRTVGHAWADGGRGAWRASAGAHEGPSQSSSAPQSRHVWRSGCLASTARGFIVGFTVRDAGGHCSGYYDVHAKRRIDARAVGRGWNPSFIVVKDYAAGRLELEKVIQWRTHGGEKAGANRWGAHVHPPETASALAAASGAAPSASQVPQAGVQRTIRM